MAKTLYVLRKELKKGDLIVDINKDSFIYNLPLRICDINKDKDVVSVGIKSYSYKKLCKTHKYVPYYEKNKEFECIDIVAKKPK